MGVPLKIYLILKIIRKNWIQKFEFNIDPELNYKIYQQRVCILGFGTFYQNFYMYVRPFYIDEKLIKHKIFLNRDDIMTFDLLNDDRINRNIWF